MARLAGADAERIHHTEEAGRWISSIQTEEELAD
jgi:hypothetical protein